MLELLPMLQKYHRLTLFFLGVLLVDERLSWTEHIILVCNKVARSLGVSRKICGLVNQTCLLTFYYNLIFPHLIYCSIVWASTYASYLHRTSLVQKRFVRAATYANDQILLLPFIKTKDILSLPDEYIPNMYFIFKYLNKLNSIPKPFSKYLKTNSQLQLYNMVSTSKGEHAGEVESR